MHFHSIFSRLICLFIVCWGPAAFAEWHGEIRFLSDYIYRGYSKSRGKPVVQGQIDYQHADDWFGGLSVSQVRFDDQINSERAEIEIKPYLGWNFMLTSNLQAEISTAGYIFDNKIFDRNANYAELYAALNYQDWLTLRASLAPKAYGRDADVANYELNFRRDIWDMLQFSAGLGYYQAGALLGEDYLYWNAGISWFVASFLAIDLRYVDNAINQGHGVEDHHGEFYPRPQDNKYLFSITLGF